MKKLLLLILLISNPIISAYTQQCTYLVNETFRRGNLPTGWTANSISNYNTGGYITYNGAGDWIRTPLLATPGILTFGYARSSTTGNWSVDIQYSTNGTNGWTTISTVNLNGATTSFQNTTVNLSAYSNVYIRILDSRGSGTLSRFISTINVTDRSASPTTVSLCANASYSVTCGNTYTFYDPGGLGDYANSQDFTVTFTPSSAGSKINVAFSSFAIENCNCDHLYAYQGNAVSAPNLIGDYTNGSGGPGTILSTAADGSITFRFTSDGATVAAGWIATVTCITPCVPQTASAGSALSAICMGGTSAALGGSVGGSATTGSWSDGGVGGTFNSGNTVLNTTWTPPANYSGTATMTLTTTDGCSTAATSSKTIVVNAPSSSGLATGDWLFTGKTSTTYEDPSNWLKWNGSSFEAIALYAGQSTIRPPQTTDNVRIKPNGTCIVNQPTVTNIADYGFTPPNNSTANCNNLVIESGATLTMHASSNPHFHVWTSLTNNGTIVTGTGRFKFVGTTSSINSNSALTFYEMNIGDNAITTINCNVTVTNALSLRGIVITGSNILHLSNTNTAGLSSQLGHIFGIFRRSIAMNTNTYSFPMGVNATAGTGKRLLEFVNNNILGISYLDCSASNSFKSAGDDNDLNPLNVKHYAQTFDYIHPEAEWRLTPNTSVFTGTYGVNLSIANFGSLVDNEFSVLKRPDASSSFGDFGSFYLTTLIPATSAVGRTVAGGFAIKSGFTSFSKFVVASSGGAPLPVTLTNFSASCNNQNTADIRWSTESEQNSMNFVVEKSRDLVNWVHVGEVTAAGNSNHAIDYSITDENLFADLAYYHLIQTDFNGVSKTYGPISLPCKGEINSLNIFPNPSKGEFTVGITSDLDDKNATLQVINAQGKIVNIVSCNLKSGTNVIPVLTNDCAAGLYMLRLVSGNGTIYGDQKLIIE